MKKSRYTEGQIVKALKKEENDRSVMGITFPVRQHLTKSSALKNTNSFVYY
jgi:hypothetical protein